MIIAPTDNIAELGWFIIDVNSLIPNIPRLEIVKVLPSISVGFNFFSFALFAKSLTVSDIDWIFWLSANLITGTINPSSTAIATPIWMWSNLTILSSVHIELTSGWSFKANADAFKIKSLNDIL